MRLLKEPDTVWTQASIHLLCWGWRDKSPFNLRLTLEVTSKAYVEVWPRDEGHCRFIKWTIDFSPNFWIILKLHFLIRESWNRWNRCYYDRIGLQLRFVRCKVDVLNLGLTERAPVSIIGRRLCESLLIVWSLGHFVSTKLVVCHLTCPGGLWRFFVIQCAWAIGIAGGHVHRVLFTESKVRSFKILFQCLNLVCVGLALVWHWGVLKLFLWRLEPAAIPVNEICHPHLIHFIKTVSSSVLLRLDLRKVVVLVWCCVDLRRWA